MISPFKPASPKSNAQSPPAPEPPPLPEVTEGNEESDWALWEDSVAFQDSQMQSGFGGLTVHEDRKEPKKQPEDDDIDPFATVHRNRP